MTRAFVVAFGIGDISGYEFSLTHTGAAPAVITKILYGPAPIDQGSFDYDVRAETGGCDNVQHEMSPAYVDLSDTLPDGCGVPNISVGDETPGWGSLKASY